MSFGDRRWHRPSVNVAVFTLCSVLFSWPLITRPFDALVSRHFDAYSMLWLLDIAPGVGTQLITPLGGHPFFEDLRSVDSFVLLILGWLFSRFMEPVTISSAITLIGPVLSALAAQRFAELVLKAEFPWSIIAGIAYAFSGLAATALLEGHVYTLLDPWIPLLGIYFWKATRAEGRVSDGLLSGLFWSLALLTTAYAGIAASLLALWVLIDGLLRRSARWKPVLASAAVVLSMGLYYLWLYSADTVESLNYSSFPTIIVAELFTGSTHPSGLAGVTPLMDAHNHSITPTLGFTVFCLALVAPRVLRGQGAPPWKSFLGLAFFVLALSLGPMIGWKPDPGKSIPWLLYPLAALNSLDFRFPVRLLWTSSLAFGAVAALVATRLGQTRGRLAWGLFLLLAVDLFGNQRTWARTQLVPMSLPSAYRDISPEGAILEALPIFPGDSHELDFYMGNLTCAYQRQHRHPITNVCLNTRVREDPRHVLSGWLFRNLIRWKNIQDRFTSLGPPPESNVPKRLLEVMADLGIRTIVLHPDLFPPNERVEVLEGMRSIFGEPVARSHDGGEWIEAYNVPVTYASGKSPAEAFTQVLMEYP